MSESIAGLPPSSNKLACIRLYTWEERGTVWGSSQEQHKPLPSQNLKFSIRNPARFSLDSCLPWIHEDHCLLMFRALATLNALRKEQTCTAYFVSYKHMETSLFYGFTSLWKPHNRLWFFFFWTSLPASLIHCYFSVTGAWMAVCRAHGQVGGLLAIGAFYCLGASWSQWRLPGIHLPYSVTQSLITHKTQVELLKFNFFRP